MTEAVAILIAAFCSNGDFDAKGKQTCLSSLSSLEINRSELPGYFRATIARIGASKANPMEDGEFHCIAKLPKDGSVLKCYGKK